MTIRSAGSKRASGWFGVLVVGTLLVACLPEGVYEMTPPSGLSASVRYEMDGEVIAELRAQGWTQRGPIAYTHSIETTGAVPLARLERGAEVRYAVDGSARQAELSAAGFVETLDLGFTLPETSGLPKVPLYALVGPGDPANRLTTSRAERDALIAQGFQLDTLGVGADGVIGLAPVPNFRLLCPEVGCEGAKGLSIVIHGGGWQDRTNGALPPGDEPTEDAGPLDGARQQQAMEQRWLARGWAAVSVSYRSSREGPHNHYSDLLTRTDLEDPSTAQVPLPGSARYSVEDTGYFYEHLEEILGSGLAALPTCAVGNSAGGHLALLLGASHHEIDCIVDDAGPTDLRNAPLPGEPDNSLRAITGSLAQFAFGLPDANGQGGLRAPELSPFLLQFAPEQEILMGFAQNDYFVGPGHGPAFVNAPTGGIVQAVEFQGVAQDNPNAAPFVHSFVNASALSAYRRLADEIAERVAGP